MSQTLVVRALAQAAALPATTIAARLMGEWPPTGEWFAALVSPETHRRPICSRPYPFYLASPLDDAIRRRSGDARQRWLVEWKWDGIRAQLVAARRRTCISGRAARS